VRRRQHSLWNSALSTAACAAVVAAMTAGGPAPVWAASSSNPGFESGLTGWAAMSGTAISVVQDPVHGGLHSASLSRQAASGPAGLTDSPDLFTGLPAGDTCTASAWVNGPVGYKATVKLIAKNGSTAVKTVSQTLSFNGNWQQLPVVSLVMPSGSSTADLQYVSPAFPLGRSWNLDDTSAACSTPPPSPTATDQAVAAGLYDGNPIPTYGAAPYDYNNDGLQDVLIEPHYQPSGLRLYHNDGGGHFTQVYKGQFINHSPTGALRVDFHGCDWADVDRNGLPDVYCTMGANRGTATDKANVLWLQQPGGGFIDRAAAYGVTDPAGPGRDAVFLDVNKDGYPDLYVTNNVRTDGIASPNRLYINVTGASLRDSPQYGLDVELGGLAGNQAPAQAVDFNHDGWQDLFVCSGQGLRLYRNDAGTGFTNVTPSSGLVSGKWRYAVMADVNKNGWLDVLGFNANATQFRIQFGAGATFGSPVATRAVSSGVQVGVGDANADSQMDVYIVTGGSNPDILMLGNGTGQQFTDSPIPQAKSGSGQSVTPSTMTKMGPWT
jgi:FG-GAP-like repeat